jgi:hypothetical protein
MKFIINDNYGRMMGTNMAHFNVLSQNSHGVTEKNVARIVIPDLIIVCKDCGLKDNLDKCMFMKISQKAGGMKKIKCNNH